MDPAPSPTAAPPLQDTALLLMGTGAVVTAEEQTPALHQTPSPCKPCSDLQPWEGVRKRLMDGYGVGAPQTNGSFPPPKEQAHPAGDSAPGNCHHGPLVMEEMGV